MTATGCYPLRGRVRHYAWGGTEYIPRLLGVEPDGRPWAEYWLGAHPDDPAQIQIQGQWHPLDQAIASEPGFWLGTGSSGELSYLMKILDVDRPLSIQVHPDPVQAAAGFAREEAMGIARNAPERMFSDPNHKPEMALALSDFWLLYGFRQPDDMARQLRRHASLAPLADRLTQAGLDPVFNQVMGADQATLRRWLIPLFRRLDRSSDRDCPDYWIGAWRALHASDEAAVDRGVLGLLMMHLLRLAPGETVFQDANVPHAYLRGRCAEIMSSSDNVLRCGLTSKHVDPDALAAHVSFDTASPARHAPMGLADFHLQSWHPGRLASAVLAPTSLTIALLLQGQAEIGGLDLKPGAAAALTPGRHRMTSRSDDCFLLLGSPGAAAACPPPAPG